MDCAAVVSDRLKFASEENHLRLQLWKIISFKQSLSNGKTSHGNKYGESGSFPRMEICTADTVLCSVTITTQPETYTHATERYCIPKWLSNRDSKLKKNPSRLWWLFYRPGWFKGKVKDRQTHCCFRCATANNWITRLQKKKSAISKCVYSR